MSDAPEANTEDMDRGLPQAFYFAVVFAADQNSDDAAFQEVSGISTTLETEPYHEGGQNDFVVQFPTKISHSKLVLKRGVAKASSKLVKWCVDVLENGFPEGVKPALVSVRLLNVKHEAVRIWNFENAYPVGWEIESLNSTKSEVAIEKIELQYSRVKRGDK